jgi:hypothetical protein
MALRALRPATTWHPGEHGRGGPVMARPAWSDEVVWPTDRLEEPPRRRFAALLALVALSGLVIGAAAGLAVLPRQGPGEPTTAVAAGPPETAIAPVLPVETPRADRPAPPAATASSLRAALVAIRKRIDAAQAGMPEGIGSEPALEASPAAARAEPDAATPPRPEPLGRAAAPRLHATREVARLRAAPGGGGEALAVLEPHVIVEEIDRRVGWVQVRYIDRFRQAHAGWIPATFLRPIAGSSSPAAGDGR